MRKEIDITSLEDQAVPQIKKGVFSENWRGFPVCPKISDMRMREC
jgi:hypothetical protein